MKHAPDWIRLYFAAGLPVMLSQHGAAAECLAKIVSLGDEGAVVSARGANWCAEYSILRPANDNDIAHHLLAEAE